jgi:hypothetical protein
MNDATSWANLFWAASNGLISADEFLDACGEPRRPWPLVKTPNDFCVHCQQHFASSGSYGEHMRRFHIKAAP